MNTALPRLGVDIGRVIISGPAGAGDTAFFEGDTEAMLTTPAVTGAFAALARLAERFGGRVWLISQCGETVERRTLTWLAHHRFAELTGVPLGHARFCRARADKALHCTALGITHFVDDRPEVLGFLDGVVAHRYLFGAHTVPEGGRLEGCGRFPGGPRRSANSSRRWSETGRRGGQALARRRSGPS